MSRNVNLNVDLIGVKGRHLWILIIRSSMSRNVNLNVDLIGVKG